MNDRRKVKIIKNWISEFDVYFSTEGRYAGRMTLVDTDWPIYSNAFRKKTEAIAQSYDIIYERMLEACGL